MRIGFYGDSYCDLQWFDDDYYLATPLAFPRELKTWAARIIDDFDSEILSSGLGGSSLFYAIATWKKDLEKFKQNPYDVVIFTFSWYERLYTPHQNFQPVFLAKAERRPMPDSADPDVDFDEISFGIDLYYKYFCQEDEQQFYYELSLKYILALADQYPDTKFIFLPCTEFARNLSLKHFTNGVLLNFSFEMLSNLETGSPGAMPILCNRSGHLNDHNNESFAKLIGHIINNYESYRNQIVDPDFTQFDLTTVPVFNRLM
jgi:hypothetical protein